MSGRARGLWPFLVAGAIAVAMAAGLVMVWRSSHRAELESFAGLTISVAGIAAGWIAWVLRHRDSQGREVVSGREVDRLADLLAGAVDQEWIRAAGERGLLEPEPIPIRWQRPARPFAGPVTAAVASTRFAPLPGLAAAGEQQLRAGHISKLHEVYGGVGSGRLVIAGGPGAGKTGAAVLLILAALRHRRSVPEEVRSKVPVPVMFTLHGWDPGTQRAQDWLAERLRQAYPLFGGKRGVGAARGMLDKGRIAVILDGLDEIPESLRPTILRALSQQATFRLVLLTRSAEMADAAAQAVLQGAAAIELQPVDPDAAAGYLTRTQLDPPPRGWDELTSRLRQEPDGPLAQALNNPLMLTLVRDTYRSGDDASDLLGLRDAAGHPVSSEDITGHLLDRVLPAAYTRQPGESALRYDLPTAERALRRIAARMNKEGTRDLQWWQMPAWVHAAPRFIATWLGAWLVAGLVFGLGAGLVFGFSYRYLLFGLWAGIPTAIVAGIAFGRGNKIPRRIAPVRWQHMFRRRPLVMGLLAGLVAGFETWQIRIGIGITAWLLAVLIFGLVAWLGVGIVVGISQPGTDNASPLSPLSSWRSDRAFGLISGLITGLVVALGLSLISWTGVNWGAAYSGHWTMFLGLGTITGVLAIGFVPGFLVGLVYPQSWSSSLAFAQLAASDRTPVRLMWFLEDARSRGILRTVGPSISSATPACRTAWQPRNRQLHKVTTSSAQRQEPRQPPQRH